MSVERAQLSIKFSIERLRAQARDFADQQYPGDHPGPKKWLKLVDGLLSTADERLTASQQTTDNDKTLSLVRDAAQLGVMAYRCLNFMHGSDVNELPYSVVPPLQRWFDQLGLSNTTFFRAELVANYELATLEDKEFKGIREPSSTLSDAINEISWPLRRVTVPSKAFAILPHFAIVAHEIGHALYPQINWDQKSFSDSFSQEEVALIQRISQRLGGAPQLDNDTFNMLQATFFKWLEELVADAFALCLTGPAIFFSLSDFLQLLGGSYGLSLSHPANDLRRKFLFEELKRGDGNSFAEIFRKHTGIVLTEDFSSSLLVGTPSKDDIFQDMVNRYKDVKIAAVLAELHESIPKMVSVIYDHVKRHLQTIAPDALYTSQRYDDDLSTHLQPMLAAIPPIEVGVKLTERSPTEFASILNVGWAVLLTKLPELRVKVDADPFGAEKLERLHGLLLKAVELSEARRDWGNA